MNSFIDVLKEVKITKKPKVYCFYRQRTWLVIIDRINLKTVKWDILGFKNPSWDINDSDTVKVEKLKNNILDFYSKNIIE
jgi:hypothetical protein